MVHEFVYRQIKSSNNFHQVNKLSKPVIINAPDLVTALYSIEFSSDPALYSIKVKETLEKGKYFITYSEYIRQTLMIRDYRKPLENVVAIKHTNNTSLPFIAIDNGRASELNAKTHYDVRLCRKILNQCIPRSCPSYYRKKINFDNVHYIFYASQIRPHKNFITLFKAFEYLLRKKYYQFKLIITGNVNEFSQTMGSKYIYEHNLEHDVIALSGVSTTTLAALYKCAELVVNPSMYEGGFAFSFGESMSVGTPCIIANAPFEMEILEPAELSDITFDPTNWLDLANKIEYGFKNREELYNKELPLYEKIQKRTPNVVAKEYIDVFTYFYKKSMSFETSEEKNGAI